MNLFIINEFLFNTYSLSKDTEKKMRLAVDNKQILSLRLFLFDRVQNGTDILRRIIFIKYSELDTIKLTESILKELE